ncbi:MAG: agmatinase family protein [Oligoflexales bacterium]|nr:agmatinase family protein [Oligoflexales bacterium]
MPPASDAGIFGLSDSLEESKLVILPVPWDATASYGKGAADAAKGILNASHQLDLEDLKFGKPYENGIHLLDVPEAISDLNKQVAPYVAKVRKNTDLGELPSEAHVKKVNECSDEVNAMVENTCADHLENNKFVAVLGGDHSSPLGLIKSLARKHPEFGILHIDAHFDLRNAYEGFAYSHASIMHNVLREVPAVQGLVQVGIRDFCAYEKAEAARQGNRVEVYYDSEMFARKAEGHTFKSLAEDIVSKLPNKVYVSFDIDGLNPNYCPGTGTPVPGGLDYHEACYLLEVLACSGKRIIGFDLCEVASQNEGDEWDFNVGSRVLYKLCGALFHSQTSKR